LSDDKCTHTEKEAAKSLVAVRQGKGLQRSWYSPSNSPGTAFTGCSRGQKRKGEEGQGKRWEEISSPNKKFLPRLKKPLSVKI